MLKKIKFYYPLISGVVSVGLLFWGIYLKNENSFFLRCFFDRDYCESFARMAYNTVVETEALFGRKPSIPFEQAIHNFYMNGMYAFIGYVLIYVAILGLVISLTLFILYMRNRKNKRIRDIDSNSRNTLVFPEKLYDDNRGE